MSLGYYSRTDGQQAADSTLIGNSTGAAFFTIRKDLSDTDVEFLAYENSRRTEGADDTMAEYAGSCRAENDREGYRNGVSVDTDTGADARISPNRTIYLGAENDDNVAAKFSGDQCAGAYVANGLSTAQVLAHYNAIQALNTTFNRQV